MKIKKLIKQLIDLTFKSKGNDLEIKVNGVTRPIKFELINGKDFPEPYINICITEGKPVETKTEHGFSIITDKYYPEPFPQTNTLYFWVNKETWTDEYKKVIIKALFESGAYAYVIVDGYVNGKRQMVTFMFDCVARFQEFENDIIKILNNN